MIDKKDKFSKLIDESIENVKKDREYTYKLLDDICEYLGQSKDRHREVGIVAAKYLEVLQRSNEQLVKTASLIKPKVMTEEEKLGKEEKEEMYKELEEGGSEEQV